MIRELMVAGKAATRIGVIRSTASARDVIEKTHKALE